MNTSRVEFVNACQPPTNHDDLGILQCDSTGDRLCEAVHKAVKDRERSLVARSRTPHDLGNIKAHPCPLGILLLQRRPAQIAFDASLATAVALRPHRIQNHVSPFPGYAVPTGYQLSPRDQTGANASAEHQRKHIIVLCGCTEPAFSQRKTICIIGDRKRPADVPFQILIQRVTV